MHQHPLLNPQPGPRQPPPPIVVPPEGAVPVELKKVTLPEYVIEPPDVIRIEALIRGKGPELKNPADPAAGYKMKKDPNDPKKDVEVEIDVARSLPFQPVFGEYTVRPDGTVYLGVWGSVKVAGYTLSQAEAAVRETLARQVNAGDEGGTKPENLVIVLDVTQYNSKYYYVFTDGGGAGMQVARFPVTGSETVLDAMTNVGGLSPVSSQRNIWVARRCPGQGSPDQILPVDWVGISQHGTTTTNYQIMPGDRVFVKAQRLVTIDTTMARIIQPIERLFGVVLLGGATVQTLKGNVGGNGLGI
jgi:polysaccharide export outer membrane protein